MNLDAIQSFMRSRQIEAWLVHDFRGNNPVLTQLLPGKRWTTRRAALLIPARGEASLLTHMIDAEQFKASGVAVVQHLRWQEYRDWMFRSLSGCARVAMEYSAGCMLPVMSIVDAGTVELVRSQGCDVVSSADLVQASVAVWSAEARRNHADASRKVADIKDGAFALIRERLAASKPVTEYEVQQWIMSRFAAEGLETPDPPIVGVNEHSGDPHFEVSATSPRAIKKGDWILIDLWARVPGDENIYSDITWCGYAGSVVPDKHRRVYEAVRAARDACLARVQRAWSEKRTIQGWEADEAAREQIVKAGFERFIRHRTGHSLSPGPKVHGIGVNIDNTETHDTREILPGIGFTIEPGIYLPPSDGGFGVRLEIDVHVDEAEGPRVTSCLQEEIVLV
jgi:Xaa-Pro aminopeptidase